MESSEIPEVMQNSSQEATGQLSNQKKVVRRPRKSTPKAGGSAVDSPQSHENIHTSSEEPSRQQKRKRSNQQNVQSEQGATTDSAPALMAFPSSVGQNASEESSQPPEKKQKHTPNPNRQKPRITRACDQCRTHHARCTGAHPCINCIAGKRTCTYDGKYNRGNKPSFWDASEDEQRKLLAKVGHEPNLEPRQIAARRSSSKGTSEDAQEHGSPFERIQNSLKGAIVYTQKSSIFRFGDPPYPHVDTSFISLPPVLEARQMVVGFFENVAPTIHFLHLPSVNTWLNEMTEGYKDNPANPVEPSKRAVIFMLLAIMQSHKNVQSSAVNSDLSFVYFQSAEMQLDAETGETRLPTIQARLLQCFFLLSRSRIHQCWSIFGTIINLIFATGLHRKNGTPGGAGGPEEDMIILECRKRVFWVAYVMDRYLSAVLGRPMLIQDEDIDQELPELVDDKKLTSTSMFIVNHDCPMKAIVCQMKLAMVIGHILKKMYPLRIPTPEKRHARADAIERELELWQQDAATFVEFDESVFVNYLGIIQSRALKLSFANAEILLYRNFLLEDINNFKSKHGFGTDLRDETREKVHKCLDAAMRTTDMINELCKTAENFKALWFAQFCGYSAIVALYVFIIRYPKTHKIKTYLKAAEKCQKQIKMSGDTESFANRFIGVLEELHAEAAAKLEGGQLGDGGMSAASRSGGNDSDVILNRSRRSGAQLQGQTPGYESGSSISIVDKIRRWGFLSLMSY